MPRQHGCRPQSPRHHPHCLLRPSRRHRPQSSHLRPLAARARTRAPNKSDRLLTELRYVHSWRPPNCIGTPDLAERRALCKESDAQRKPSAGKRCAKKARFSEHTRRPPHATARPPRAFCTLTEQTSCAQDSVASEYRRHEQGNPFALISGAPSNGRFYGIFVPWITVLYSCNLDSPRLAQAPQRTSFERGSPQTFGPPGPPSRCPWACPDTTLVSPRSPYALVPYSFHS